MNKQKEKNGTSRIGLFFGSFNPIHNGHLGIARYLLEYAYCEAVWWIISPCNPFKAGQDLLPEQQRLEMVEAAIAGDPGMRACDIEFNLPKPSYTIDTLNCLSSRYPGKEFVLVIGADNLVDFHLWKAYKTILSGYHILVYPRQGVDLSHVDKAILDALTVVHGDDDKGERPVPFLPDGQKTPVPFIRGIVMTEAPLFPVSSTEIREMIRRGEDVSSLLPPGLLPLVLKNYGKIKTDRF